jgi:hypothetical protein
VATLQRTGLPIAFAGRSQADWFRVGFVGARYEVYNDLLIVYEWPNVTGAEAAAARISGGGFVIGGNDLNWPEIPHFYRRGRIIVLYLGRKVQILGLLSRTLGPPIAAE